jgi:uncharacterized protein YjbI with pentapeptide repeats
MPEDFSHNDLRGKSFKGQDLTGANFKGADIRGVNFKGAVLARADFSNAHAGLRPRSRFMWFIISLVLSFLAGFLWAFAGFFFAVLVDSILESILPEGADRTNQTAFITIVFFLILSITGLIAVKMKKFST